MGKITYNKIRLIVIAIVLLAGVSLTLRYRYDNYRERFYCDGTGSLLGAGTYTFYGVKYDVKVCRTRVNSWSQDAVVVAMMVYKHGSDDLLAERYFDYDEDDIHPWGVDKLKNDSRNLYYGHGDTTAYGGAEGLLSMPPTWIDWIRARIP